MIIDKALAKVFGTANERELKRLAPLVAQINSLEPQITALSDGQLRDKTAEFRAAFHQRRDARRPAAGGLSPSSAKRAAAR